MKIKEYVIKPELHMKVYHDEIYNGNEQMTIVGIREHEVELAGDYSGGTHNVYQKDWLPLNGTFRLKSVCDNKINNSCTLNNIQCNYPNCEHYL